MEEILHQLIGSLSHHSQGFFTSQVVQDFFHQQYNHHLLNHVPSTCPRISRSIILRKASETAIPELARPARETRKGFPWGGDWLKPTTMSSP